MFNVHFCSKITSHTKYTLLVCVASAIIVTGSYGPRFYPANISYLILPLVLYITIYIANPLNNIERVSFKVCAIMLLFLYPFLHPLTSIIIIVMLLLLYVIENSYRIRYLFLRKQYLSHTSTFNMSLILILFVAFISWFSTFSVWNLKIRETYNILFKETISPLSETVQLADKVQFNVYDIFELLIKMQGGALIYIILACVLLFIYIKYNKQYQNLKFQNNINKVIILLLPVLILQLVVILFPTGIDMFRPLRYTVVFSTLMIGLIVLIYDNKYLSFKISMSTLIFGIVLFLAIMSYPSPYKFQPNPQITYQDVAGTKWIETNKNSEYEIIGIWPFNTYINTLAILEDTTKSIDKVHRLRLINHFGYDESTSINGNYTLDTYVPIFEYDRATQLVLWKSAEQFYENDFYKLSQDSSVNLIYKNGETEIWKI